MFGNINNLNIFDKHVTKYGSLINSEKRGLVGLLAYGRETEVELNHSWDCGSCYIYTFCTQVVFRGWC